MKKITLLFLALIARSAFSHDVSNSCPGICKLTDRSYMDEKCIEDGGDSKECFRTWITLYLNNRLITNFNSKAAASKEKLKLENAGVCVFID